MSLLDIVFITPTAAIVLFGFFYTFIYKCKWFRNGNCSRAKTIDFHKEQVCTICMSEVRDGYVEFDDFHPTTIWRHKYRFKKIIIV